MKPVQMIAAGLDHRPISWTCRFLQKGLSVEQKRTLGGVLIIEIIFFCSSQEIVVHSWPFSHWGRPACQLLFWDSLPLRKA